ncbi:hypothetical protein KY314_04735 [Candidatus Woesearchaeota archaeon]|nr:hypothetical protein [Candidatus Woesearchaeota archaeon]
MKRIGKLVAAGIAAVVFFTADSPKHNGRNEPVSPTKSSETSLEEITFEVAKRAVIEQRPEEELIVQAYLNSILINRSKYDLGIDGWGAFQKLIYDPGLKKMWSEYERRDIKPEWSNKKYQDPKKGFLMMATPAFNQGKKCDVYISRKCLEFIACQDELLSGLDNEAFHAGVYCDHKMHLQVPTPKDSELWLIMCELMSFDLQFKGILYGHRKVRNEFIAKSYDGARVLFRNMEQIANENSARSKDAKKIYNCLLKQPTFPFFVPKEERANKKPYNLID